MKAKRDDISANVLAQTLWAQTNGILQFISTKQKILEFTGVEAEDIINSQFEIIKRGMKNEGKGSIRTPFSREAKEF
ncbi:MAG: hypothetical protein KAV70_01510 [Bacteroidales bacterium]|nr:hypothetical protein [Bacteroidales bacterium]